MPIPIPIPLILISVILILLLIRFYIAYPNKYFKVSYTTFPKHENEGIAHIPKTHEPLLLQKGKNGLLVITDPVGVPQVGENACVLAQETIKALYDYHEVGISPREFLKQACFQAHRKISEQINLTSGGCSIGIVYIERNQLYWVSSGNIAIFLYREELEQLNQMDLYKHKLKDSVLQRKLKPGEVISNSLKDELTAYLGYENLRKVELCDGVIYLKPSDKLLLATRKVYETLPPIQLENLLKKGRTESEKIKMLGSAFWSQVSTENVAEKSVRGQTSAILVSRFKKHKL
jgi:serine/threonine protein phosphatase PrpC